MLYYYMLGTAVSSSRVVVLGLNVTAKKYIRKQKNKDIKNAKKMSEWHYANKVEMIQK